MFSLFLSCMVMVNQNMKQHDIAAANTFQMQWHTFSVLILLVSHLPHHLLMTTGLTDTFSSTIMLLFGVTRVGYEYSAQKISSTDPLYKHCITLLQQALYINTALHYHKEAAESIPHTEKHIIFKE